MVKKENSGIRTIIGLAVLGILLVAAVPLLAAITDGLDSADALVVILSKDYLKSAFCSDEWQSY